MTDVFRIAEILVENVKDRYPDDISLIAYYGSYANGTATAKSDLDFFYIPAPNAQKPWDACIQFIIGSIGFDFWPITWERAERIVAFNEGLVSLIADSKILYARSGEDSDRFNELRNRIASMGDSENRRLFINKAIDNFKDSYMYLYNLQLASAEDDLASCRMEAYKLATTALQSLALLNQTYYRRGWGQNMDQVLSLRLKPEALESCLREIVSQRDCALLRDSCEVLVSRTRQLLLAEQITAFEDAKQKASFSDVFGGFYEEAKGIFNKLSTACERNDRDTAFFASLHIQKEISEFLAQAVKGADYTSFNTYGDVRKTYDSFGLPDLASLMEAGKLRDLKAAVDELDAKTLNIMKEQGINLHIFDTVDEFEAYIKGTGI